MCFDHLSPLVNQKMVVNGESAADLGSVFLHQCSTTGDFEKPQRFFIQLDVAFSAQGNPTIIIGTTVPLVGSWLATRTFNFAYFNLLVWALAANSYHPARTFLIASHPHFAGPPGHIPITGHLLFNPSASTNLVSWPLNKYNSSTASPRRGPAMAFRLTAKKTLPPALTRRSCHAVCPISKLTAQPSVALFSIQKSRPQRQPFRSGVPIPINVSILCQWISGKCF